MNTSPDSARQYSLDELSTLANVPRRTVRYYIQRGLLDRPIGETRAAYYTEAHLQQLLQIRKWTDAGLSLEAIRELLADDGQPDRLPAPRVGSVTVKSHLVVSPGLELVVEPTQASLKPEEVRRLFKAVLAAYDEIAGMDPARKKNTQKEHGK